VCVCVLCSQKLLRVSRAFFLTQGKREEKRITAELATFDYFAWFKFRVGTLSAESVGVSDKNDLFFLFVSKRGGSQRVVRETLLLAVIKNSNTYTTHE